MARFIQFIIDSSGPPLFAPSVALLGAFPYKPVESKYRGCSSVDDAAMRSNFAALPRTVGRLGCRSRRLGTLAPSVRARYEEEALSRLRATPAIDPALVTVKSVVVRQSGRASCSLEFASAACPQRAEIEAAAQKTLLDADWVNGCDVEARVRRPPSFMGAKAPPSLQHVGALIGVSSCKGGVGKSTVAVNLAFALAGLGARVGLLDADVHGPSLPSLVALSEGSLPIVQRADNKLLTPPLVGGVRLMSYGFIAKGASTGRVPAAVMRGPMVGKVVGQMLSGTEWGDLDYLLGTARSLHADCLPHQVPNGAISTTCLSTCHQARATCS